MLPVWAAVLLAGSLFVSGCSRKSSDTFDSQATTQTNQGVQTANPDAASASPGGSVLDAEPMVLANGQPNMDQLNRVARAWLLRNSRRPADWADFVAHAGVQIPPPPPGKKYVLDTHRMHVTLENR